MARPPSRSMDLNKPLAFALTRMPGGDLPVRACTCGTDQGLPRRSNKSVTKAALDEGARPGGASLLRGAGLTPRPGVKVRRPG